MSGGNNSSMDSEVMAGFIRIPEWVLYFKLILVGIIISIGVPGNWIIIFVQLKNRQKSSTDCFVLSMAICDIVLAGVVGTMQITESLQVILDVPVSDAMCKTRAYLIYVCTFASTQLVSVVAFDRYRHTCRPHSKMFNSRQVVKVCVLIAVSSMMVSGSTFGLSHANRTTNGCAFREDRINETIGLNTFLSCTFIAMIATVIGFYSKVVHTLRNKLRGKVNQQTHLKDVTDLMAFARVERGFKFPMANNRVGATSRAIEHSTCNTRLEARDDINALDIANKPSETLRSDRWTGVVSSKEAVNDKFATAYSTEPDEPNNRIPNHVLADHMDSNLYRTNTLHIIKIIRHLRRTKQSFWTAKRIAHSPETLNRSNRPSSNGNTKNRKSSAESENSQRLTNKDHRTSMNSNRDSQTPIIANGESQATMSTDGESLTSINTNRESQTSEIASGDGRTSMNAFRESQRPKMSNEESQTSIIAKVESNTTIIAEEECKTSMITNGESQTSINASRESLVSINTNNENQTSALARGDIQTSEIVQREGRTPEIANRERHALIDTNRGRLTTETTSGEIQTSLIAIRKSQTSTTEGSVESRTVMDANERSHTAKLTYGNNQSKTDANRCKHPSTDADGNNRSSKCSPVLERQRVAVKKLTVEYNRINRTTKLMFLVAATYTFCWIALVCMGVYLSIGDNLNTVIGASIVKLKCLLYMINSIFNPVLFMLLSSRFRERARALLC